MKQIQNLMQQSKTNVTVFINQLTNFILTQTSKVNTMLVSGIYKGNDGCYCISLGN